MQGDGSFLAPVRMKNGADQEVSMPRRLPRTIVLSCVAVALAQVACSLLSCDPFDFDPPAAGQTMLWADNSTMVYIPGGSFVMGQDEEEPSDHSPAHTVTLSPYWIYQAEVTNRMYRACVELGVCTEPAQSPWYDDPEYENAPVSSVDWNQAKAYCEWMNLRLPTEAEWELAGRGTDANPYPWSEDEPTCDLLNFLDCLIPSEPDAVQSYPLGLSLYDVADMAGNVSEWMSDWYAEDYYGISPSSNPMGPETGEDRVVRGSSYLSPVEDLEIVRRSSLDPLESEPTIGFRCAAIIGTQTIAPMCSVHSYDPTWDPLFIPRQFPLGNLTSMYFICFDNGIEAVIGTDFELLGLPEEGYFMVPSSPQGDVTCGLLSDDEPFKLACNGDAIQPGLPVTITLCWFPPSPEAVEPICPHLYQYNPATSLCEYGLGYGGEECLGGITVEGYGCLFPPQDDQCPAGSFSASYNGEPVCVPASGPICLNPDRPPAACPEGLVFNEGNICCEYPPDVSSVCPSGFTLDAENALCVPEPTEWCTSITNDVPLCAPAGEPPPPEQATGCWISTLGPPTCAYPCPEGVPNNGPCTP